MGSWHLPWKYIMVMDFGSGEPTGYLCARCGRGAIQYAVLLTDADLRKFYFDLHCAAQVVGSSQDPEEAGRRATKLRELGNKGSIKIDSDLINL